ncbi:MAG: DUF6809 family protein [Eubacteriales bacterium]
MTSVIKELWYGNICPKGDGIFDTSELKELLGYMARHQADLKETLTDKQKEVFDKLMDNRIELDSLTETAIFEYRFKLGAKMMLEMLAE